MNLYFILAGVAVALGLSAAALFYRGNAIAEKAKADQLAAEVSTLKRINEQNLETIKQLSSYTRAMDNALLSLSSKIDAINVDTEQMRLDLEGLTDDESRSYLNDSVPDGVRRVLNR